MESSHRSITLTHKLIKLNEVEQTQPTFLNKKFGELEDIVNPTHQIPRPKIQKVAEYLRNRKRFEKQYSPKSVSIGPIHHDNQILKLGESYKLSWAAKYIKWTGKDSFYLHKKIVDKIHEIRDLYAFYVLENTSKLLDGFNNLEEKLSWMLFVDGCFLLYILLNVNVDQLHKRKDDQLDEQEYVKTIVDKPDAEQLNINKVDQLVLVMMDVLLLENQLPYLVLKLLWYNDNDDASLILTMTSFLKGYHLTTPPDDKIWGTPDFEKDLLNEPPTHLLDLQRKIILFTTKKQSGKYLEEKGKVKKQSGEYLQEKGKVITYRKIEDLTAVGINLKSSGTRRPADIDFSEGWFSAKLILPEIVVDDTTAISFLNLVAYELCPDFQNDYGICTFLSFMDSLIDHAEDVKKLRSESILMNLLGSDQNVADLFKLMTDDLVPIQAKYYEIRYKIDKYRSKKFKIWIAQGIHIYFSNPWAITGVLAGVIALALTFAQTWFTIYPR